MKDSNLGVGKAHWRIVFGFLFTQFNFICPITRGRLNKNLKSDLICKAHSPYSVHTCYCHLKCGKWGQRSTPPICVQLYLINITLNSCRKCMKAVAFQLCAFGGQEEIGPDMKD